MRLLEISHSGQLTLTGDLVENIPPYAILSHTWGADHDEVTFNDMKTGAGVSKAGYTKIRFCAQQAQKDDLRHFWVDTCCIDKANNSELAEAIVSMYRWYYNSAKCYVFLADVSALKRAHGEVEPAWEPAFSNSRWFTRGWTLQELLAPKTVEFFSREGKYLGSKSGLGHKVQSITGIPMAALSGTPLREFSIEERMQWAAGRNTKKEEDRAYCLLGIFNIFLPLIYGEGGNAFKRLREAIEQSSSGEFSRRKEALLRSLNFGSPFTRPNNISTCTKNTFDWVFNVWTERSFRWWLQQGEGIYWIKGKPGSGKSTLVKFITGPDNQNRRTLECLKKWAGSKPPRILSFYFWLADKSNNQNSFRGFLCHLLHQLLVDEPPESVSRLITAEQVRGKQTMENWDPNELETLLKSASHRTAKETPLCFFIDGLDECVGTDLDRVVKMMQELALTPGSKIKICVSSRPEQKIENRFRDHVFHSLELHRYTEADIKQYVTNEFKKCPQAAIAPSGEQEAKLTEKIVSNSQGVFLWAVLVTRKLCESIEFGDTFTQLEKQLEELPPNMAELYQTILERSDAYKGHRRAEAASYFRFALDHCGGRRFRHTPRHGWFRCKRSGSRLTLEHFLPLFEIYHGHIQANDQPTMLRMRQRINHLCAGIIVVDTSSKYIAGSKVDFFHRTARDYLYEPSAQGILDQGISQLESFRLFADNILKYDHGNCSYGTMAAAEFRSMIAWIREMDEMSEADKVKFLRHIDEGMKRYYAAKSGTHHGNWVHEQAPSENGNDQVADLIGLAIQVNDTEFLSRQLDMSLSRSDRYKDYLLLCSSVHDSNPLWRQKLLDLGANPNATFYWGLQDRLRTSPWLKYLIDTQTQYTPDDGGEKDYDQPNNDLDMGTVEAFLESGANLNDRTVLLKCLFRLNNSLGPMEARDLPPRSLDSLWDGMFLVIEVNAKYLLEEQCHPERVRKSARRSLVLSRPEVRNAQAYRRVLLVHPGYETHHLPQETDQRSLESLEVLEDSEGSGGIGSVAFSGDDPIDATGNSDPPQFAEVNLEDSERLLDSLNVLPHQEQVRQPEGVFGIKLKETMDIWQRSPKIPIFKQFLEERGYYRQNLDLEFLQEAVKLF